MSFPALDMSVEPEVEGFFDPDTNTISYIVKDPNSDACAIIDSVLDIDYAAGRLSYNSADRLIDVIEKRGLTLEWIIETHVHADHLSAAPYLQQKLGGKTGVGAQITEVQRTFGKVFNEGTEFQQDGSQFDALFEDGDTYTIGGMIAFAIATPGHTPACMVHVIGNAAFAGDTLFMPDGGSARADFPGGDAGQLYDSIKRYFRCRTTCGFSFVTTMVPMVATSRGRPQSANRRTTTFTSVVAKPETTSSNSGPSATRNCRCPSSSFRPFRSTCVAASSHGMIAETQR